MIQNKEVKKVMSMDDKTFDKIQKVFGKSYNFDNDEYWRPKQKEFQILKKNVLELLNQKKETKP